LIIKINCDPPRVLIQPIKQAGKWYAVCAEKTVDESDNWEVLRQLVKTLDRRRSTESFVACEEVMQVRFTEAEEKKFHVFAY
jgi:hypothetical protein